MTDLCLTPTLSWHLTALAHAIFCADEHATELRESADALARDATMALARGQTGSAFDELVRDCAWAMGQAAVLDEEGCDLN